MRIIGLKLFKPVMFCCSTKRRFFLFAASALIAGFAAWYFWPRADANPATDIGEAPDASVYVRSSEDVLTEGLELVQSAYDSFDSRIADYTATFEKQERVNGVLLAKETMFIKMRQQPFSVYLRHTAPEGKAGQEAIFVEGQNDGNLVAHPANAILSFIAPQQLPPKGTLAMMDNRHDITTAGMKNLLGQLLKLADEQREDLLRSNIRFLEEEEVVKVDGRSCRCLEIRSPEPLPSFPLAVAKIYFDEAYGAPVRYEAWEWTADGDNELVEFYEYSNVKLNAGVTDDDFDPDNPEYDY